jgi:hypothetical protein
MAPPTEPEAETSLSVEEAAERLDAAAEPVAEKPVAKEVTPEPDTGDPVADEILREEQASDAEPPEFWAKADKEAWQRIPLEMRPVVRKYEEQRAKYANEMKSAVAASRRNADEVVHKAASQAKLSQEFWQQVGPRITQTFVDRWAGVDFATLADDNPAEWARLSQIRADEQRLLQQAQAQAQHDKALLDAYAADTLRMSKWTSHQQLTKTHPEHFGPKVAESTYKQLSEYLHQQGWPADVIEATHEPREVTAFLKAMLWDRAQNNSAGNGRKPTERRAPTRIAPGPGNQPANQGSDGLRQARVRFHRSGSVEDGAALLSKLKLN